MVSQGLGLMGTDAGTIGLISSRIDSSATHMAYGYVQILS